MKTNKKATALDPQRLAGGCGQSAARQGNDALLRRVTMACLLGEDVFYQGAGTVKDEISRLVPLVSPNVVRDIAVEARTKQQLRHVPLFIAVEMLKHDSHRKFVGSLLPQIILRADELAEFLALYWRDGKVPLAKQAKIGLKDAFSRFNEYHFAKYDRDNAIKLRDVMFLVHPRPDGPEREELYKRIASRSLATPRTWEVLYSAAQSKNDKRAVWEALIEDRKLGSLAFLRNLRNMEEVGVPHDLIRRGILELNPSRLVPLNIFTAAEHAPRFLQELEDLFFRSFTRESKLPGYTIFVIDVSGSMAESMSRGATTRLDVGVSLAVLAREMCERVSIYATAGNDFTREHATTLVPNYRGFALRDTIRTILPRLGGGGIFTRQCLNYIREQEQEQETPDRIIVFSDSQDCDRPGSGLPKPFGKRNYIVDVSSHTRGIAYPGIWDAEISGWSERFLDYILVSEGVDLPVHNEE